ncbi:hypothetical protein D3C84_1045050 [compost metagenome]
MRADERPGAVRRAGASLLTNDATSFASKTGAREAGETGQSVGYGRGRREGETLIWQVDGRADQVAGGPGQFELEQAADQQQR